VKRPVEPREYHAPPGSRRPRPADKPIPVPPLPPGGIEAFFGASHLDDPGRSRLAEFLGLALKPSYTESARKRRGA
jgi:hypothetical protein